MSPRDKIKAVIEDPSRFYLNVHSAEATLNPPPPVSDNDWRAKGCVMVTASERTS